MRLAGALFLLIPVAAAIIAFWLPRGEDIYPPATVTLAAAAVGLWVAFTAQRDAKARLAHVKHGFTVHGDERLLLRGHLQVYVVVLLRLQGITAAGLATAIWGHGWRVALWFFLITIILMVLAWPNERKTHLLLRRGHDLMGKSELG